MGPSINYVRTLDGGGRGVKPLIHFSYTYHMQKGAEEEGGGGGQIACKNAYVINGRPLFQN